jgi:hypothetical protein
MRKTLVISAVGAALVLGGTAAALAATGSSLPTTVPSTSTSAAPAAATTSESDARRIATGAVPGSRVTETEMESEAGRRAWKVHLSTADARYEVHVDAADGHVLKTERAGSSPQSAPMTSTTVPTTMRAPGAVVPDDYGRDDSSSGVSDDGPGHDLGDDHGGARDDSGDDNGGR